MCVCTVPQATASCCLTQKGLTVASAARSTGMNFANSLFNHVYGLGVRLSQVGFSAMMKRLGCESQQVEFSHLSLPVWPSAACALPYCVQEDD